jgi:hypothetical protein
MATTREYLNAIMFSGMLDCLASAQAESFLRQAARTVPKYVYKFDKVVGTPPTAANTRIVATERYELEKVGKYTVLHCLESQMRAIAHLPKCKAGPLLKSAVDEYEKAHK